MSSHSGDTNPPMHPATSHWPYSIAPCPKNALSRITAKVGPSPYPPEDQSQEQNRHPLTYDYNRQGTIIVIHAHSLSARIQFFSESEALERFFHGMLRLRSSRQMLRQAIVTSKPANAIAVANTVMIVANERTYITPYANVRNTLFPAPPRWGFC